jgi:hypothetical protein
MKSFPVMPLSELWRSRPFHGSRLQPACSALTADAEPELSPM